MQLETKRKFRLFVLCFLNLVASMIASMQCSFYPKESALKGYMASQYGFVFGIFQINASIFSLIYGKFISYIGVSTVNISSILGLGITCFLFGCVDLMYDLHFYIFSLVIRIIEGILTAAFITSSYVIISTDFMENVNFASSFFFSGYGVGLIIGPAVGGALFEIGGFLMPFAIISFIILFTGLIFIFTLRASNDMIEIQNLGILKLIKIPSIAFSCCIMFCQYFSIGFLDITLSPHLRQLNLNSFEIGIMFFVFGLTFSASSPIWGYISDKFSKPNLVCVIGSMVSFVLFLLIGPAPFLVLELSLYIETPVLFFLGFSLSAISISTYSAIHLDAIRYNVIKPTEPNCLISGIWICACGIGSFSGATIGGILFDFIGFAWTAVLVAAIHFVIMVVILGSDLIIKRNPSPEIKKLIS